ncbi:protease PrtS [Cladorrhinum sp. PSN332]|nr:protease PrtS [Cladorrhinum sp. PSN332]
MACQDNHICSIVPPILLERLCESQDVSESIRQHAHATLELGKTLHQTRHDFFEDKCRSLLQRGHDHLHTHIPDILGHGRSSSPSAGASSSSSQPQGIVPGSLFQSVIDSPVTSPETKETAQQNLAISSSIRDARQAEEEGTSSPTSPEDKEKGSRATATGFQRNVYDVENKGSLTGNSWQTVLPGKPVRLEGQDPTADQQVNEAYDMALVVLKFYKKHFNCESLDGKGMEVNSSVHFGQAMGNAFWLGNLQQMVYGDGDDFLHGFTRCVDVIGHEMTHAVIQYNAGLVYKDESGALNEHIADVFGIMVKQMYENEDAANADWLIGEGCLLPGVKGVSLRSMKDPGSAYDDPRFGFDLQPGHTSKIPELMKKYGNYIRNKDYGGVHIFSGIPNKAFYLASVAFKGYSWEKAGQIWWKVLTGGKIPPNCKFVQFADATVDAAEELYGDDAAKIVRNAWNEVGVVRKT